MAFAFSKPLRQVSTTAGQRLNVFVQQGHVSENIAHNAHQDQNHQDTCNDLHKGGESEWNQSGAQAIAGHIHRQEPRAAANRHHKQGMFPAFAIIGSLNLCFLPRGDKLTQGCRRMFKSRRLPSAALP
jgi:hypothetical protein